MSVIAEVEALADALDGDADADDTAPGTDGKDRVGQATALVRLALADGVEPWHDPEGNGWATLAVDGHAEHYRLNSRTFRRWLTRRYHEQHERAAGSQALQEAIGVLEGKAAFEGAEHPTFVRVAEHGGDIYLDLGLADWRAVRITPDGWQIVANSPVYFRRPKGLLALPPPTRGGSIGLLRRYVHVANDDDWRLIVSWLVAALRPTGPYPLLALYGEQGSGKSTTARLLASLVDPRIAALRAEPKDTRDVAIAATNGWLVTYDNVSHIAPWFSDVLCRLATGGGFGTRTLYTDDEEQLFDVTRPALFTAIEEIASRGDLLDRALVVTLPTIPERERRPESALWTAFERDRPAILGALLDAVSFALRELPRMQWETLPRMADFALWASAAAPVLGWTAEEFRDAYTGNRAGAQDAALDAVAWLPALRTLPFPWAGTATELLDAVNQRGGEAATRQREWPKNGRALAGQLRRLAPALRATGLDATFTKEGHAKTRTIQLRKAPESSSAPSAPSAASAPPGGTLLAPADANADVRTIAPWVRTQTNPLSSADFRPSTRGDAAPADDADGADAKSRTSLQGHVAPKEVRL